MDIQTRRLRTIEAAPGLREKQRGCDPPARKPGPAYTFVERSAPVRLSTTGRADKRVVLRFLVAVTGLSHKQLERLVTAVARQRHDRRPSRRQLRPPVRTPLHGGRHSPAGGHRHGLRAGVRSRDAGGPAACSVSQIDLRRVQDLYGLPVAFPAPSGLLRVAGRCLDGAPVQRHPLRPPAWRNQNSVGVSSPCS